MRVRTHPGQSTLTPTPNGLSCAASASDMATTANLLATYGLNHAPVSIPAMEAVLTMWPPSPWARMCGTKAAMPCRTPIRLTSSTHRQVSGEALSPSPPTPALLQTTWMLPNASKDAVAARSTLAQSATSQATPRTPGPTPSRLSTAAASASASMSASMTFMPACANARPSARPMPLAPPVTNAALPANPRMFPPVLTRPQAGLLDLAHGLVGEFGARCIAADHEHQDRLCLGIAGGDVLEAPRHARRKGDHVERPEVDELHLALFVLPAAAPGAGHRDEGLVGVVVVHHRAVAGLGAEVAEVEPLRDLDGGEPRGL